MDTSLPTTGDWKRGFRSLFAGLLALGLGWLSVDSLQAAGSLLVLHSYHSGYWWTDDQAEGIRGVIDSVAPPTEIRLEYLDFLGRVDPLYQTRLLDLLRVKYAREAVAVVLTTDEPALKFAIEFRNELFPDAAIVFSGLQGESPAFLKGQRKITGVIETRDPTSAMKVIRRFHPRFHRALVIFDPQSMPDAAVFRADLMNPGSKDEAVDFTLMSYPEFEAAVGHPDFKPEPELIFLMNSLRHSPIEKTEIDQQVQFIRRFADVPIYHICSPTLGTGSVGGDLYSGRRQGAAAAALALRILRGEDPESLPVQRSHFARFVVDYPEFQRWGLNPKRLTRDLVVINRPFSFYATYHELVWTVTGVIAILLALVAILGWTIVWNKRVERSLKESEKRLEFTQFAVDHAAMGVIWMDAQGRVTYANAAACQALDDSMEELLQRTVFDFDLRITRRI